MPYCPSCNRSTDDRESEAPFEFRGTSWYRHCSKIQATSGGVEFVPLSSPGRMTDVNRNDPLDAWQDCYEMKPKKRILKKKAKEEILRTWALWDGDKSAVEAKFRFFGWLNRHRPYFLTFRERGDPWQTVHCWLIQYETKN
ncbi:MAG: hypothetical protein ACI9Y1_003433 [Lentisphaeria bacterium]|jgi:hypothetical protein